jgi:hypothetical protein
LWREGMIMGSTHRLGDAFLPVFALEEFRPHCSRDGRGWHCVHGPHTNLYWNRELLLPGREPCVLD